MALDIDGTLLDSEGKLSDVNKSAVAQAIECGVMVSLVTGRRFSMAARIALLFDEDLMIVSNNGAVVKTSRSQHLSYWNPLPLAAALEVLRLTRAFRGSCVAHAEESENGQLACEQINSDNRPLRWYLDKSKETVHQVDSLESFLKADPIQLMFGGPVAPMNEVVNAVAPLTAQGRIRVTKTEYLNRDVCIVDVLSPTCSKAAALEFLLREHGWSPENLMAVGDNYNDHDMLELAAVAVVMGQSVEEMKTENRHVTLSNDEDGVARALERFVLGPALGQ